MIRLVQTSPSVLEAIHEDEVGLQFGIIGSRRFKTVYQVVYDRSVDRLTPAMLRAGVEITGVTPLLGANRGVQTTGEGVAGRLGALLALCNYRNADIRELQLYLDLPLAAYSRPGELEADLRLLSCRTDEFEIDPEQVICELPSHATAFEALEAMARQLRRRGAKIALAHEGPDDPLSAWMERLRPDYIRVSGGWFARLSGHRASRQLLASLVRAVQSSGTKLLFECLDSPRLLSLAVEAGADCLQGDALQPAGLVGTLIDPAERLLPTASGSTNVVPMNGLVHAGRMR